MENEYYSIVTNVGTQKIAEAINSDSKVNIIEFAVGDGGGAYYKPTPTQKGLKNEMWRGLISACYINENSENVLVIESVIPSNVGGYTIREMAVFDEEGNMIAICNTPDTQKVDISDGVIHELDLSIEIAVTNTESIQLVSDPNVINATKKDVKEVETKVYEHIENRENPHYVTKEQIGLENVDNTGDVDKPVSVPMQEALDAYYAQLTAYTDKAIGDLINGAPTTMDTLKELADAIKKNEDIQTALDAAIGAKASKNEFDSHVATMASKTAAGHVKIDDALSATSTNPVQNKVVKAALDGKANTSHTHSYAGASTSGGSATSAVKLDTTTAGAANKPIYWKGGKPAVCANEIIDFEDVTDSINWGTATNYQAYRIGKVVFITFMCIEKPASANVAIVAIPTELIPSKQATLNSALVAGADINKKSWCYVNTDGFIRLHVYLNGVLTAPAGNTLITGFWIIK